MKDMSVKYMRVHVLEYMSQWILDVVLYKYEIEYLSVDSRS